MTVVARKNRYRAKIERAPINITILRRPPDQQTIELLEALLEKAKRGETQGTAILSFEGPQGFKLYLTGQAESRPVYTLGALSKIKHAIISDMDE